MQASTYFPMVRRMLLFVAPLSLIHFWPASTLLRGHLALATLSPPETDPQIYGALGLRWWGSPGQVYPSEGFWSRILVWRAVAFVNFTRWIGFCMSELFRRIDFGRLHVLKYTTHLTCVRWSTSSRSSCQLVDRCHDSYQVAQISRDFYHGWQQVAVHFRANHSSSTWLLHFCHHSF